MIRHEARRRRAGWFVGLALLFLSALGPDVVRAGGKGLPAGSVVVHVTLPASLSVADASVVLTGARAPALRLEVRLDERALAWFEGLSPQTYDVQVLVGGRTRARTGVAVDADEIVSVQAVVADGLASSSIRVTHRVRDEERTAFHGRLLEDLPGSSSLWGLVETAAPFVVSDSFDTGGLATVSPALLGSRGASWTLTTVAVGDVETGLPSRTGIAPVTPDLQAIGRVAVVSGLASPDVRTPGVRLELTPRMPAPTWSGVFQSAMTTPGLVGTNRLPDAPSVARLESFRQAGVFVGGPLGDRVGLTASIAGTGTRHQERDRPGRLETRGTSLFTQVVARASDAQRLRVLVGAQRARFPLAERRQFLDPVDGRLTGGQLQVSWDSMGWGGSRRLLTAGLQVGRMDPLVSAATRGGTVDRLLDGVVPDPAVLRDSRVWDLRAGIDRPAARWGAMTHTVRAGISVRQTRLTSSVVEPRPVAETVAGLPARVWQPVVPGGASVRTGTELAVHINDHLVLGAHGSLAAGVRIDRVTGRANGAATGITWTTIAPRVSFRWSPTALGVFGGYGRYLSADVLPLLAYGDPAQPSAEVYRWTDPNGDGRYQAGETGDLVMLAGAGAAVATLDAGLRPPTTDEWTIGGDYRPNAHTTLRGAIVIRQFHDLPGLVNIGVPESSYRTFTVPDAGGDEYSPVDDRLLTIYDRQPSSFGQDAFLLTSPAAARARYEGIEISWTLHSARWTMLFGATAYRTRGWGGYDGPRATENDPLVIGDRFARPFDAREPAGSFFFDRSYIGKWSTSYRAPGDVRVGLVVRYQDGQPFSRMVVLPDLSTGPGLVQAYRVGRTRFTYTGTVDLRIEKGVRLGGTRLALSLEAFNLTNLRNEVEEDIETGPTFRLSTAVQPPRTLRAGLRVEF